MKLAEILKTNYLFRVVREDELVNSDVLWAKDKDAMYTLTAFLTNGSRLASQFIATTKSIDVAYRWARQDERRIAVIDIDSLDDVIAVDCSTEQLALEAMSSYIWSAKPNKQGARFAAASVEVDLEAYRGVPVMAIFNWEDIPTIFDTSTNGLVVDKRKWNIRKEGK